MYRHFLIAAACIYLTFSACISNANLANLQAGDAIFSVQEQTQQIMNTMFDYTFKNSFSASPNVALALQGFSIRSPNITQWVIAPNSVTQSKLSIKFTQQPAYWISVRVRFIASARPDITVGSQLATFSPIKGSVATVTVKLNTQLSDFNSDTISKLYATGYRKISGNSMDFAVSSRSMTESTLTFNIQTGADFQINYVQVNYIIFNPKKVNFASYGGSLSKNNFSGSLVQNIQREVHDPRFAFYGLVSIKFTQSGSFNLQINLIDPFYARMDAKIPVDQFSAYFVIVGVPTKFICTQCQEKYIYQNKCQTTCPVDAYSVNYSDGATGCRKCPNQLGMIVNGAKDSCVCRPSYLLRNGICEQDQSSLSDFSSFGSINSGTSGVTQTLQTQNTQQTYTAQTQTQTQTQAQIPIQSVQNQNLIPNRTPTQSFTPNVSNQSIPQVVSNPTPTNTLSIGTSSNIKYQVKQCSLANSFWTGYRCTCKPGFALTNGVCTPSGIGSAGSKIFKPAQFIYKISYLYTNEKPTTCDKPHQIYNGQICVCAPGYEKNYEGGCVSIKIPDLTCPLNSKPVNGACICDVGYVKKNDLCSKPSNSCPLYSYYNGVQCVCNTDYYMDPNSQCTQGKLCPPYSTRKNGECVCLTGYRLTQGSCTRCPEGQVYIASQDQCIFTCGVNQQIDYASQQCKCKLGFGKYEGICNICPRNFFNSDGYCVVCPIGSTYNEQTKKCVCGSGLIMHSSGYCQQKCIKQNQIYHAASDSCKCFEGLARINGNCEICNNGAIDNTQNCVAGCGLNEILYGSQCVCKPGLGKSKLGKCFDCEQLGQFLIDGYCASCPNGQVNIGNTCKCPNGKQLKNNNCIDTCKSGQLVDKQGNCYTCPLNQIITNGKCSCKQGFVRVGFFCQQKCGVNQYVINGLCGMCALNTVYSTDVKACICPKNFYMNNYGVCEQAILPPIDCPEGKYYSPTDGCLACPFGCSACKNVNTCTKCSQVGFKPEGGKCVPNCGDGIITAGEKCDDGNTIARDGCSSICQIQKDYECTGSPSICRPLAPVCGDGFISPSEQCDDKNKVNGDGCNSNCYVEPGYTCDGIPSKCVGTTLSNKGMKQQGIVMMNQGNVYVTLKTDKQFFFSSDLEMKTFMKYSFPNPQTEPASAYCTQDSSKPQIFRCLIIYPYGVPNFKFDINFSFNFKGDQGAVVIPVDPMQNSFASRSLH